LISKAGLIFLRLLNFAKLQITENIVREFEKKCIPKVSGGNLDSRHKGDRRDGGGKRILERFTWTRVVMKGADGNA
jgi:hypothetical protein